MDEKFTKALNKWGNAIKYHLNQIFSQTNWKLKKEYLLNHMVRQS